MEYSFSSLAFAVVIAFFFWKITARKSQSKANDLSPNFADFPRIEVSNDRFVFVKDQSHDDLRIALRRFCEMYNTEKFVILPRLTKISESESAITFPYDIEIKYYCFLIKYLDFPQGPETWTADVLGWTTLTQSDSWATEELFNKKVMIYISSYDDDPDCVFVTTSDNIGYRFDFGTCREKYLLDSVELAYIQPPYNIDNLVEKEI